MASFATSSAPHTLLNFAALVLFPFAAVVRFIETVSVAQSQLQTIRHLMALSDAQLADLGIKRDEIIAHVMDQQ